MSTGSSVARASIATATTRIAPIAIERSAVVSMRNSPASDAMTVRPLKSTARPEVASAVAARLVGRAAGADLLAVAGEDEQRVVDGHADADHRGHVRHEDATSRWRATRT